MKKRLEAELISIAHRVLKLKNKSEVDQLFLETQKLYEALSVLKFYGNHIEQVKATISEEELEEKLTDSLENKSVVVEEVKTEPIPEVEEVKADELELEVANEEVEEEPIIVGEIDVDDSEEEVIEEVEEEPIIVGEIDVDDSEEDEIEEVVENSLEDTSSDPIFEMASEEIKEEIKPEKSATQQISFEDLLGQNYNDLEFVKPNDTSKPKITKTEKQEEPKEEVAEKLVEVKEEKPVILNEKLATGINIGLNDRIGFVKYLFDNSNEDFNRVLSQLNTFDSYAEAKNFINEMVKPDYNNWVENEDYAERFMEIVEQKFA
jgi:hypothetical protein